MKLIKNDVGLETAIKRAHSLSEAAQGSDEFDELEVLSVLIETYERENPSPIFGTLRQKVVCAVLEKGLKPEEVDLIFCFDLFSLSDEVESEQLRLLAKLLNVT